MKICKILLTVFAISTIGVSAANAVVVVTDNFDSYADQGSFEVKWPAIGTVAPTSAILSISNTTPEPVSAPNSVSIPAVTTAEGNGRYRNNRIVDNNDAAFEVGMASIGDLLIWSFDFYDSNAGNAAYRQWAELRDAAGTATNQLVAMGLNNNQSNSASGGNRYMFRIVGFNVDANANTIADDADPDGGPQETVVGSGAYYKMNDFANSEATGFAFSPLRSTGWHNMKMVQTTNDGTSTDYYFFVDNKLAEVVQNVGTLASIRQYDKLVIGSGLSNNGNASFYDNMKLSTVAVGQADFSGNGEVGAEDYVIWRNNNGVITSGASYSDGDADGDGKVDFDDYLAWRFNIGGPVSVPSGGLGGGASVPEPTGLALAVMGLVAMLAGRRRR
jgi:hypothetical protein